MRISSLFTGLLGLATIVSAHPGHDIKAEAAERASALKGIHTRSLDKCSTEANAHTVEAANVARRKTMLHRIRQARGLTGPVLQARDLAPLNASHASNLSVTPSTDPATLFQSSGSCILAEDTTQGPYYVSGELIRRTLTESQQGIPLYLDIQLVDSSTCAPVPSIWVDLWSCNATGVYSGVSEAGNGAGENDQANLNRTFLRGLQQTDDAGVVQFHTLIPGHYAGRANHVHMLAHGHGTSINTNNGTVSGLYAPDSLRSAQIFFDQGLISDVEETEPYAGNGVKHTSNVEDFILRQELDGGIDPFVDWVLLGEDIRDGVFGWIRVALDKEAEAEDVAPAVFRAGEGGVENEDFSWPAGGPPTLPTPW